MCADHKFARSSTRGCHAVTNSLSNGFIGILGSGLRGGLGSGLRGRRNWGYRWIACGFGCRLRGRGGSLGRCRLSRLGATSTNRLSGLLSDRRNRRDLNGIRLR